MDALAGLAEQHPERVRELHDFIKVKQNEDGALIPEPNPNWTEEVPTVANNAYD